MPTFNEMLQAADALMAQARVGEAVGIYEQLLGAVPDHSVVVNWQMGGGYRVK
jgi:hypothetical protein